MRKIDYDLYQVKHGEEYADLRFSSLKMLNHFQQEVTKNNYEKVYSGTLDTTDSTSEVLESIYIKFNLQHPADYRSHSLSVSDIVVLHENGVDTAHFCDSIGFVEVPQFLLPAPAVNLETTGLTVDGHLGTWHTVGSIELSGKDFYMMEHDEYGSSVANIIVDENGKLVAQDIWHGITPEIEHLILEEQGLISSRASSMQEQDAVRQRFVDNGMPFLQTDLTNNYLANAEGNSEENYNQIDGRIDTQSKLTPGDDTESHPESLTKSSSDRSSILDKLRQNQSILAAKEPNTLPDKQHTKNSPSLD